MPKAKTESRTITSGRDFTSSDKTADLITKIGTLGDVVHAQGSSIRGLAEKVEKVSRALSFVLTVAFVGWVLGLIALAGLARFGGLI